MKIITSLLFISVFLASPSFAQEVMAVDITNDYAVAKINGKNIMYSDVQTLYDSNSQFKAMPIEVIFDKLLEDIILTELMTAEAKKADIESDPEFIREFDIIKNRLIAMFYLKKKVEDEITETKLRNQYKKYIKDNPPQDEVKARHILVNDEATAKSIIEKINKGADFAEIANEASIDIGSTIDETGGDLGWFQREGMPTEFTEVAFSLDKGEVSQKPVKTPFGWHVIRVDDKRKAKQLEFEELEEMIKMKYIEQESEKLLNQIQRKAKIEKYGIDGKK